MMRAVAATLALCIAAAGALAQPALPSASDLLFETPHFRASAPGEVLSYRYRRTSMIAGEPFGPPVDDSIRLTLEPGDGPDTRTVAVAMFTGERRRPAGPFENASTNPALLLFLEHGVAELSRVLQANPRYLKTAIRAALRDRATVTSTEVALGGRTTPGWRVSIQPFAGDRETGRMRGLETLTYVFVVAEAVPGMLVSMTADAPAPDGSLLMESLTYEGAP
jgi:hypothetical protein